MRAVRHCAGLFIGLVGVMWVSESDWPLDVASDFGACEHLDWAPVWSCLMWVFLGLGCLALRCLRGALAWWILRGLLSLAEGGGRLWACLGGVGGLAVLAQSPGSDWPLAEMVLGRLFALPGVDGQLTCA